MLVIGEPKGGHKSEERKEIKKKKKKKKKGEVGKKAVLDSTYSFMAMRSEENSNNTN
jgi:hypothetical protein